MLVELLILFPLACASGLILSQVIKTAPAPVEHSPQNPKIRKFASRR